MAQKTKPVTMHLERSIQEYLLQQSKGQVKLNAQQARHIINLVIEKPEARTAYVHLSRHNAVNSTWDRVRAITTTDATIQRNIIAALEKRPVENCYLYECYNSAGEFEGKIYCVNPDLF